MAKLKRVQINFYYKTGISTHIYNNYFVYF